MFLATLFLATCVTTVAGACAPRTWVPEVNVYAAWRRGHGATTTNERAEVSALATWREAAPAAPDPFDVLLQPPPHPAWGFVDERAECGPSPLCAWEGQAVAQALAAAEEVGP
ncbi:MAG: hypothetical protein KC417_03060 [Myxococcales bacterium]|nr:hypothetical protein [Myxococcales bacterium]